MTGFPTNWFRKPDERSWQMNGGIATEQEKVTREEMVRLLNEDLAREYQAVIAYVVYSQTMKGAKYQHIAGELKKHAGEELNHALKIAKQIDYFGGEVLATPKEVKLSDDAVQM